VSEPSISAGSLVFTLSEVRGLYDYHSQGSDELDVSEGARIELTSGPSGGQNYAEGWWEGQLQHYSRFESFHTKPTAFSQALMRWEGRVFSLATMWAPIYFHWTRQLT
jgi:hypothetical protein